tara:strand:- start:66 stop:374 length:309 start_codon:yes stop_codon:yes gene_type:complete
LGFSIFCKSNGRNIGIDEPRKKSGACQQNRVKGRVDWSRRKEKLSEEKCKNNEKMGARTDNAAQERKKTRSRVNIIGEFKPASGGLFFERIGFIHKQKRYFG